MEKKEIFHTMQEKAQGLFTRSRLKKAGALLLVCAALGGGGAWYHHQQEQLRHQQVLQARTAMIESIAAQNNLTLLDRNAIQALAAQAIGQEESAITYREIALMDASQQKHEDKSRHEDKHEKKSHRPEAQDYQQLTDSAAQQPAFQPIYKVSCKSGNVKYSLRIDAVTGKILQSKAG